MLAVHHQEADKIAYVVFNAIVSNFCTPSNLNLGRSLAMLFLLAPLLTSLIARAQAQAVRLTRCVSVICLPRLRVGRIAST